MKKTVCKGRNKQKENKKNRHYKTNKQTNKMLVIAYC